VLASWPCSALLLCVGRKLPSHSSAPCSQLSLPLHGGNKISPERRLSCLVSCIFILSSQGLNAVIVLHNAPRMSWPTGLAGKRKALVDAVSANEADPPSIASSRHTSRARVTDCMTAFSNCGSLRGSLLVSSTLLSIIRLAFVEASLCHRHFEVSRLQCCLAIATLSRRVQHVTTTRIESYRELSLKVLTS